MSSTENNGSPAADDALRALRELQEFNDAIRQAGAAGNADVIRELLVVTAAAQKTVAKKPQTQTQSPGFTSSIHHLCVCPITKALFVDPVVAADTHTYERAAILEWLKQHETSPLSSLKMEHRNVTGNQAARNLVQELVSLSLVDKEDAAVWHYSVGKLNWCAGQSDTARSHFQSAAGLGSREADLAIQMLELQSQAAGLEDVDWMFPQVQQVQKKRRRDESEEIPRGWMYLT